MLRKSQFKMNLSSEKRQTLEDLFLETHEDQSHVTRKKRDRREEPENITAVEAIEEDRRS